MERDAEWHQSRCGVGIFVPPMYAKRVDIDNLLKATLTVRRCDDALQQRGYSRAQPYLEHDDEDLAKVYETNFRGYTDDASLPACPCKERPQLNHKSPRLRHEAESNAYIYRRVQGRHQ